MKLFSKSGLLIALTAIAFTITFATAKRSTAFYGDSLGYYLYLPSALIYQDIRHMEQIPTNAGVDAGIIYYANCMPLQGKSPIGYCVNQYTYGIALTELPFFLIAHIYEKINRCPANGYSEHYDMAIAVSALFYTLLGLLFTRKILGHFVKPFFATLGTCIILIASNIWWFSIYQPGMSHIPLFCLYAILIWYTISLHKEPHWSRFLIVGLLAGLITVIRPTDILCVLIPLLYNIYDRDSWKQKIDLLKKNRANLVLAAVGFILAIAPQLLYWKITTGQFLYDSYRNQSFNWGNPKIIEGLFYAANGWLIYSPVFILAICGLLLARKFRPLAPAVIIILPLYVYIIYCWFCYTYINGFGSRPMIHLYPLLAIPLAVLSERLFSSGISGRILCSLFLFGCTSVNIAQSRQQSVGDLSSEQSNLVFNLQTLFRTALHYDDLVVFDLAAPQPKQKPKPLCSIGEIRFADSTDISADGNKAVPYVSTGDKEYPAMEIKSKLKTEQLSKANYFFARGYFKNTRHFYDTYRNHLLVLSVNRGGETILWKAVRINNKAGFTAESTNIHINTYREPKWGDVSFYLKIPDEIQSGDEISLRVWNPDKTDLWVSELSLELCR